MQLLCAVVSALSAWQASPSPAARAPIFGSTTRRVSHAPLLQYGYDEATYNPELSGLAPQAQNSQGQQEGMHGTGYRFMPSFTVDKKESSVIVCIAGAYPGVTADQLAQPAVLPFAEPGKWNYHLLKAESAPGGFVALAGSELLWDHPDTVAIVCQSDSLGLSFDDGNVHEVLALVDRSDDAVFHPTAFNEKAFYALADEQGVLHIRWADALPAGWRVCGRVIYTQMPHVVKKGRATGFAEYEDDFEF